MKEYYRQIKTLTAIALVAFAALLIFACFSLKGIKRLKNEPAKALSTQKSEFTTETLNSEETKKAVRNNNSSENEKNRSQSAVSEVFDGFPVNINTADATTLMQIPGIGQAKANEIVAYRNANGKFTCAEDLLNVYGISEATLAKIYGYITV